MRASTASVQIESEIAAADEADFTEQEIAKLSSELARISSAIKTAREFEESELDAATRLEQLRKNLDASKVKLDASRAKAAQAKATADAIRDDIDARIAHITTSDHIAGIRNRMLYEWRTLKAVNRGRFEELQDELSTLSVGLAEIGVECRALNLAAYANWNRPDRDKPDLMIPIEFSSTES